MAFGSNKEPGVSIGWESTGLDKLSNISGDAIADGAVDAGAFTAEGGVAGDRTGYAGTVGAVVEASPVVAGVDTLLGEGGAKV